MMRRQYVRQCQELAPEYAEDIRGSDEKIHQRRYRQDCLYAETWTKYLKSQGYQLYVLSNYSSIYAGSGTKKEMPFLKYMDGSSVFL